jgi:hypothetical protein
MSKKKQKEKEKETLWFNKLILQVVCIYHKIDKKLGNDCNTRSQILGHSSNMNFLSFSREALKSAYRIIKNKFDIIIKNIEEPS